jgi:2',3'-cyclic-nucleotide 2'-phosphodiesterase (5'-nucleotidase family)
MRRRSCLLTCGLLLVAVGFAGAAAPLTILYTNDLHLRFARLESLGRLIETEREAGAPILLLDGGDAWQDFRAPIAAVWGADAMVDWMNTTGYDAMALGNHETYWGADRLAELAARAEFPILCANLRPAPGFSPPFVPTAVREIGGIRVLLVGVVTSEYLPYPDLPWLTYVEPAQALAAASEAASEDFDLLVAVGHIPVAQAARIAEAVPGIDVFVTGHSHERTADPLRVGKTLIVQSGAFGHALGRLRLDVADGAATVVANELLPTEATSIEASDNLRPSRSRCARRHS